jgi:hypothetical protein
MFLLFWLFTSKVWFLLDYDVEELEDEENSLPQET